MSGARNGAEIRVGLVARGRAVAGGEVSLLTLARQLPAPYRPVVWVTEDGELAERAAGLGLEVVHGRWILPELRYPSRTASLVGEIRAQMTRLDLSLLHINSPVEAAPFIAAARLARRPSVVHVRIDYPRRFLRRQGVGLADAVIFNSQALRASVGWPSRAEVIPNGVEPPTPLDGEARAVLRQELGAVGGELLIGHVGQLIPSKGVDLSLRALALLDSDGLDVRLAVVGDDHQDEGRHRVEMEGLARELGLSDRVSFTGYRRDAARLMGAFDLLWCPSREEAFGRVLIEAMSQGIVPVASRVGGIPEVVDDGIDGCLVPPERADELARISRGILLDSALRGRMGENARDRVEREFTAGVHARRVASLYDRVGAPYMLASAGGDGES